MTSPLQPYANSYLLLQSTGAPTVLSGRIIAGPSGYFLVRCFLTRQDSSGARTGADYLPSQSSPGNAFPGSSGDVYLYRGYALQYAVVTETFSLEVPIPGGINWRQITTRNKPLWLTPGINGKHLQGSEEIKYTQIERVTGKYGGVGIDELVSDSIEGIPLLLRSGDLLN